MLFRSVMSDFLGCMSGLPYAWRDVQSSILALQTVKLTNIYQELYLATSWKAATVSVSYTTYDVGGTTYYTVTGVSLSDGGGGYNRGAAPVPTITIAGGSGATAICQLGVDSNDIATYGKVISVTLTSAGTDTTTLPTITIQCPPTATLPVQSDGSKSTSGTNTSSGTTGWTSPMETVVGDYIVQANTEISLIQTNNSEQCSFLNKNRSEEHTSELQSH